MTKSILGVKVHLRMFAPGDDSFSKIAAGTITEQACAPGPPEFAQGYKIKLDDTIHIEGVAINEVAAWPSGSYNFNPAVNKMLDLFEKSLTVTVSWKLPDGTSYTYGEKGTFAEVTLVK